MVEVLLAEAGWHQTETEELRCQVGPGLTYSSLLCPPRPQPDLSLTALPHLSLTWPQPYLSLTALPTLSHCQLTVLACAYMTRLCVRGGQVLVLQRNCEQLVDRLVRLQTGQDRLDRADWTGKVGSETSRLDPVSSVNQNAVAARLFLYDQLRLARTREKLVSPPPPPPEPILLPP